MGILRLTIGIIFPIFVNGQVTPPTAYSPSAQLNYIRVWDAVKPDTNLSVFHSSSSLQTSRMTTQYFDGLGRPLQTVTRQGSLPTGSVAVDLVSAIVYDELGREQYKYLPFAANNTGGNTAVNNGGFKLNPFQQQATCMQGLYGGQGETWFYSQTVFESSALSRPSKQLAAGNSWVGSNRGVEIMYWTNTIADSVVGWKVTNNSGAWGTYSKDFLFPANELNKTITKDENGKQIVEFKDKQEKVLLKKVQLSAPADSGAGSGYSGWLCTYYIYDDFGQLRCVIQPEGVKALSATGWILTTTILNEQCFRYEYDKRMRMMMKKVPGSGSVWMVYDSRDRLVLTQDSAMRSSSKWLLTQYDGINRPVITALINDNNSLTYHMPRADTSMIYPASGTYILDTLTATYYDDYSWRAGQGNPLSATRGTSYDSYLTTASTSNWPYALAANIQSSQTKGLLTGSKVKVLGSSTYLFTVSFYDENGRVVQTQSNNISGGIDTITTQYGWAGKPILTIAQSLKSGVNAQSTVTLTQNTYDSLLRIIRVEKRTMNSKVNNGVMPSGWTVISQMEYDALGQLKKKKLGTVPLDSMTYDYNIRGWMLGMNRSYVKDTASVSNYFGFDLGYDKVSFAVNGMNQNYSLAQYNGNIGGMLWRSTGDDSLRKYDFSYDAANRLLSADFNQYKNNSFSKVSGLDFSLSGLSYDANGNIVTLNQKGWKVSGSETIDSLYYSYISGSNKLLNVLDRKNDTATRLGDFRASKTYMNALGNNKTTAAIDYAYDGNGNLKLDNNKDISFIRYNYLNLPDSIVVTGKGNIVYTYDAAGNKLRKKTTEGSKITSTLYMMGNFVNDTLQFIGTEEGRARFNALSSSINYDYFIKDHLGNIRMMLTEEQKTDMYPAATMEASSINTESAFYGNLNNTVYSPKPSYFNDPLYPTNAQVARLKNTTGVQKVGPNIILKVMAGDSYNIRVASGWSSSTDAINNSTNVLSDLLNLLSTGMASVSSSKATPLQLQDGSSGLNSGLQKFMNTQSTTGTKPKAYINWILLDERFKYYDGGFEQVGNSGVTTLHVRNNLTISKSGYLYIYTSNEATNIDVFFDNLQVTHIRGPLLEETHYYPFGLRMEGICSKAAGSLRNSYQFNDCSELQNQEFSNGSGLETYDATNRMYDPQLGRFFQPDELAESAWEWSPYQFALDNPIRFNDPLGLEAEEAFADGGKKKRKFNEEQTLPMVTVKGVRKLDHDQMQSLYWNLRNSGVGFSGLNPKLRERLERWDGIQRFMENVHAQQREQEEFALEVGSYFLPVGWITKLKYAKLAVNLYKLKRGASAFRALTHASEFGIKTYKELKGLVKPIGTEVHHLIEKRFAGLMGEAEKDMLSIVVTKEEHAGFTRQWYEKIGRDGWNTTEFTTSTVPSKEYVQDVARDIYKNYPEILKALGL